ncbi:chemotaxis protein CheA [Balneatrix alpica]|uniref:chemotaxis protein CheA n=1 Tax=Balneatrix alpica TaxID=75684 RepID=UPI002739E00C|nr:chemotaxis protein CheA [Balneatrix alpica]
MSIDLSQFYQVFFEESFEGLDMMESALLDFLPEEPDAELINSIFRAAHSLKGSSGTFGFTAITEFTHVLETLLDQVRDGERRLDTSQINLLLESVDCLRAMLQVLQQGQEVDTSRSQVLQGRFEAILAGEEASPSVSPDATPQAQEQQSESGYLIQFKPSLSMLCSGNEPLRMFRELAAMGELQVQAHTADMPDWDVMQPESCYLSWTLQLQGESLQLAAINEVFEWVEDECELSVTALGVETPLTSVESDVIDVMGAAEAETVMAGSPQAVMAGNAQEEKQASNQQPSKSPTMTKAPAAAEVSSIRVGIDKIDSLINMVGELVITQSMLEELSEHLDSSSLGRLQEGLAQMAQHTRELQENVMRIRMLPISVVFNRFPRLVRDVSQSLGKQVELRVLGEHTELDKTVLEKIGDPLVHLVRNALDHGLEAPEVRQNGGKAATGVLTLHAYHQGGSIVIEISDDGAGINGEKVLQKAIANGLVAANEQMSDEQIYDLLFMPGFSTADQVSDLSGRGVGMDVVRRNIEELNGTIETRSKVGEGTRFIIRLPLTLAILDGQLIKVCGQTYILPLVSIVESIQAEQAKINLVSPQCRVLQLRDEYIPILRLAEIFNLTSEEEGEGQELLVILEVDNSKVALVVDDLLAQQQVVIKSLEENYRKVNGVSGATILGNGQVSFILDVAGLLKMAGQDRNDYQAA